MIVKTINGEKSEKKQGKKCKRGKRRKIIELRWRMTKIIGRNSLGNLVIFNFSGQKR